MSFPAQVQWPTRSRVHRLMLTGALAAIVGLPACSSGFGSFAAPVAAVVGGTPITEADVVGQIRLDLTTQSNGQQLLASLTDGTGARQTALATKRDMLTSLVQLEVVRVQGRKMGITVSAADVRAATSRVTAQTAFVRQMTANGAGVADISTYEATHLVLNQVHTAVTKGIVAAPEQVAAAYAANKATYDANYHAAHILICSKHDGSGNCADNPADAAQAKSIAQQAAAGADFGQLAARYSVDRGSATKGGDLGWVSPGQLVPEFEQAALALKPGEITAQPVKSQFGYHVIKLIAKGESLVDASPSISNSLEQTAISSAFDAWLSNAIAHTRIQVNPIFGTFNPKTGSVVAPAGAVPPPPANPGPGGP